MRCQTWCHCRPVETPSRPCSRAVRVEEDVHDVRLCGEDWRQEVPRTRGRYIRVAAAPVHQGCPVPFYDFDVVAWAVGTRTKKNLKAGELQPQHLPILCLYRLHPLQVVRITFGVVWRGDHTCCKQSFKLNSTKGNIFESLTLAATAVWRAKWWPPLPESGSSGRVGDTSKAEPGWIWALATAAVFATRSLVFAVSGFKVCAGAAEGGQAALWWKILSVRQTGNQGKNACKNILTRSEKWCIWQQCTGRSLILPFGFIWFSLWWYNLSCQCLCDGAGSKRQW